MIERRAKLKYFSTVNRYRHNHNWKSDVVVRNIHKDIPSGSSSKALVGLYAEWEGMLRTCSHRRQLSNSNRMDWTPYCMGRR